MSIGSRLKGERGRLGLSQATLAELVGTTQKTQFEYEKDVSPPKATYLAAIAEHGVDVLYVLTGTRNTTELTADEQQLLTLFRNASLPVKMAAVGALQAGMQMGSISNVVGNGAVQIGVVVGGNQINSKGGKKGKT